MLKFGAILPVVFASGLVFAEIPAPSGGIVHRQISGVELHFFSEIDEVLQALTNKMPRQTMPPSPSLCVRDLEVTEALARSCPTLGKHLEVLQATAFACRDLENPLDIYARQPAGEPSADELATTEGILKTVLVLATKVQWPEALDQRVWTQKLHNLILKIREKDLTQNLQARRQALREIRQAARSCAEPAWPAKIIAAEKDLESLSTQWKSFQTTSLAQAQADEEAVRRAGRGREAMPFPMLSDRDREFFSMAFGAVLWRFRGGGGYLPDTGPDETRTNERRRYFVLQPMKAFAELNGAKSYRTEISLAMGLGLLKGWGQWHDMGRLPGDDKYSDHRNMVTRGEYQLNFVKKRLSWGGYKTAFLRLAGPQMGHCYFYAWEGMADDIRIGLELGPPHHQPISGGPTNIGEFCTGAAMTLGLAKTLLQGR